LAEANVETVIGPIAPEALRAADEVFITSTAGGILPVTRIDHQPVADGEAGPLTSRLRQRYWEWNESGPDGTPIDYGP
jgi:branched-chain amino acid aminotransferase